MLARNEEILSLIPHRPPFVQVDGLVSADESVFVTEFKVQKDNLLLRHGCLSESGMLENIAQSAALGFGYNGKKSGQLPKVGYIGAISRVSVLQLPEVGELITTRVEIIHRMDPVVMISGVCYRGDEKLLEGEIKLVI
jgi:predicted hotdog family 3-hydroxylacyl-ACP dehydratase